MNNSTTGHNTPLPPAIHSEFWFIIEKAGGNVEKLIDALAEQNRDFIIMYETDYRKIATWLMAILRPSYPETFTDEQLSRLAHYIVSQGESETMRVETGYVPSFETEIPADFDSFIALPTVLFEEKYGEDLLSVIT